MEPGTKLRIKKLVSSVLVIFLVISIFYALAPRVTSVEAASSIFGSSSVGGSVVGTGGGAAKAGGYFQLV